MWWAGGRWFGRFDAGEAYVRSVDDGMRIDDGAGRIVRLFA